MPALSGATLFKRVVGLKQALCLEGKQVVWNNGLVFLELFLAYLIFVIADNPLPITEKGIVRCGLLLLILKQKSHL